MVKVYPQLFPPFFQGQSNRTPGMYMDGTLKTNYDSAKKSIKKDWDMFFVIDGAEGSGKSVFTLQSAFYCDPTFNISRVTFSPDEFKRAILNAKQYQAIVFDEAFSGLSSRRSMSGINHALVDMMAEIRQKNLFVFIVLPSFFELDKYAAIHRSRCLINVYHKRFKRGFFKFYSFRQKRIMYLNGKKSYDYKAGKVAFRGTFTDFYPIDKEAYKQKKRKSLRSPDYDKYKGNRKEKRYARAIHTLCKNMPHKNMEAFSELMGERKGFLTWIRRTQEEEIVKQREYEQKYRRQLKT